MQYKDNTPSANTKFSNVDSRPNKTAKGFTKHYENWATKGRQRISNDKHLQYNKRGNAKEILSLIVRGTTDNLKSLKGGYIKLIKKEHSINKGYFKEVYTLTESGKRKLKQKKSI